VENKKPISFREDFDAMKLSERAFARRIDLTSLQLFVAVCELGSIGKAAEREFIAASAVSKRLGDLETTLDTPLLYRHTRGVDLTPGRRKPAAPCPLGPVQSEKMQGNSANTPTGSAAMCGCMPASRPSFSFA
jgi:hypothetical protein